MDFWKTLKILKEVAEGHPVFGRIREIQGPGGSENR